MTNRNTLGVFTMAMLGLALLPGNAAAQQKTLKEQIVGAWTFVSSVNTRPDGRRARP
jgi:hypothetical protein